ncbi:hypothetical protein C8R44DRAFT_769849 [Mycena epipterygia]|nr:hypothetical protein C8R44DRAFT_769849 [Mycena epipterygia]
MVSDVVEGFVKLLPRVVRKIRFLRAGPSPGIGFLSPKSGTFGREPLVDSGCRTVKKKRPGSPHRGGVGITRVIQY